MELSQHFPSKGQLALFLRLHGGVVRRAARVGSVLKRTFVVLGYDSNHVGHAAVAHFDVIFIAYFM